MMQNLVLYRLSDRQSETADYWGILWQSESVDSKATITAALNLIIAINLLILIQFCKIYCMFVIIGIRLKYRLSVM